MLYEHLSYVQAGSIFPDWGYLCGSPGGEAAHWPPFIEAFIYHINTNYEKGSEHYNRLVAFLFGVTSHMEADIVWHWGKNDQGFLRAMSHDGSDCFDRWDSKTGLMRPTCHIDGDVGADLYLSGRESHFDWANQTMTFPIADLA